MKVKFEEIIKPFAEDSQEEILSKIIIKGQSLSIEKGLNNLVKQSFKFSNMKIISQEEHSKEEKIKNLNNSFSNYSNKKIEHFEQKNFKTQLSLNLNKEDKSFKTSKVLKSILKNRQSQNFSNKSLKFGKLNNSQNSTFSTVDTLKLNSNNNNHSILTTEISFSIFTGRKDRFKTPIKRGSKDHKVTFNNKIKINYVEDWKVFTFNNTFRGKKQKYNKSCSGKCHIF